jgi:orotate phosphoribosyltransferase
MIRGVPDPASPPASSPLPDCPFPALRDHVLAHSVQRGDFTLKSGKRSEWFIDAKQTTCSPEGMLLVADALLAAIPDDVTALGGLTVGADAAAYATAGIAATRGRRLSAFTVRKEAKGHGMGGRMAGVLGPGDKVAVTEDAVTRGVSMLEAVEVIHAIGAEVVLLVPVVDRGGTVEAMARDAGLRLRALVTAEDLGFPYEKDVV